MNKIVINKRRFENLLQLRKSIVTVLLFLVSFFIQAQTTIIIEKTPENTPSDATLYIAGNFNGWQPNATPFIKNNKNQYVVTIPFSKNKIEYKITRGSWETVETNAQGGNISNRTISKKSNQTIKISIRNWGNFFKKKERKSTANTNVRVLKDSFYIPQLERFRRIDIYLPSDYSTSEAHYPVIYMQDGQNIFDEARSSFGEWQVDETLLKLEQEKGFRAIVVAIDNSQDHRMAEYNPWIHRKYGGGEGDEYVDFLVKTLKPFIDKTYRTKPESNQTAIIGSSMGGLIAMYATMKYPSTFGKVAAFSPSFWISKNNYKYARKHAQSNRQKIYMIVGLEEDKIMHQSFNKMNKVLKKKGFDDKNLKTRAIPDGKHQEWFWAREFGNAIGWLFWD